MSFYQYLHIQPYTASDFDNVKVYNPLKGSPVFFLLCFPLSTTKKVTADKAKKLAKLWKLPSLLLLYTYWWAPYPQAANQTPRSYSQNRIVVSQWSSTSWQGHPLRSTPDCLISIMSGTMTTLLSLLKNLPLKAPISNQVPGDWHRAHPITPHSPKFQSSFCTQYQPPLSSQTSQKKNGSRHFIFLRLRPMGVGAGATVLTPCMITPLDIKLPQSTNTHLVLTRKPQIPILNNRWFIQPLAQCFPTPTTNPFPMLPSQFPQQQTLAPPTDSYRPTMNNTLISGHCFSRHFSKEGRPGYGTNHQFSVKFWFQLHDYKLVWKSHSYNWPVLNFFFTISVISNHPFLWMQQYPAQGLIVPPSGCYITLKEVLYCEQARSTLVSLAAMQKANSFFHYDTRKDSVEIFDPTNQQALVQLCTRQSIKLMDHPISHDSICSFPFCFSLWFYCLYFSSKIRILMIELKVILKKVRDGSSTCW